ncbi:peroxiredoxin family protein [Rikenella microfusus]|uniref:peroxiredoxin family protein n=1 Tax=Rikenella microfusus TaxID=28139 RepID=UPI00248DD68D|nr:TlpA disulfide reductase family protein [Rikenella microfusus]
MKKHFTALSLLLTAGILAANARQLRTTVIEGTVVDRPYSRTILLAPAGQDMRVNPPQEIPIRNGHFRHTFEASPQAYELAFADEWQNGSWQPVVFFPDTDTVRMTLYPMDSASMNRITGGADNRELRYMDSVFTCETPVFTAWVSLQKARSQNGTYYNAEARTLLERLDHEQNRAIRDSLWKIWYDMRETHTHLSPEAAATDRQMQAYYDSVRNARYEHIRRHPSLAGYYWLYNDQLFSAPESNALREEIYRTVYAARYPEHPYTARLDTMFYRRIAVGKPFADFSAPDLEGRTHRLSELVAGKMALIDLWASWCGPCRRNGMAVIPVYNEFKAKGFTVVGVARETGNSEAMRKAIARDGYPWLNLLELNDRAGIWQLYGVSRGAGCQVLIDTDGTVLAIDPTAAELRQILARKLR